MKKLCSLLVCVTLVFTCSFSSFAIGGDPFTDAFSVQYKPMTDTEVSEKLNAVPLAPEGGGVLSQLSGKTYEITNEEGLELKLAFAAQGAGVSLSAVVLPQVFAPPTSQAAFKSEYAGLASGDFVLVGFREPGTARAWTVVLNLKSGLALVYEVFFGYTEGWFGATPARDAQRNVYAGKIEGIASSTKVPTTTNHLTGKTLLWENDLGKFYTNYGTRSWSAFYPLGQPDGLAGSWTAPSDYYDFHDARHFLYSRTESYYSGATLVELLDLYLMTQIGLKIGFDATDTLEFRLYSGTGKILGSYAGYGPFAAEEYPDNLFGRFAYRPSSENLSKEEVIEAIEDEGSWTGAFGGPGKDEKMFPLTDYLSGKSFTLAFDDGLKLEYQVTAANELKFREEGAQVWKTGRYEAFEVDANLIFFTHAIDDNFPDKIYLNVVDFDNGLATCMNSEILVNEAAPRMCLPTFHFGVINMAGITPVSKRHAFSNGLLGTSFTWTYNDSMVSQHYYATPDSLYYSILQPSGEAILMWSCDAWYVKFRENVYLISWMESFGSGQNDSKVFNLNTMHDAGVCYGIPDGAPFEYNTYGSEARHAGTADVSSIYGVKSLIYDITLDTNYGAATTSAITGTDGKLATLPAPTRNNYRFDGWFTAPTGGTQITTSYVFDRDAVIYAHWTFNGYNITLNTNDGVISTSAITGTDGKLASLPTPARNNYRFSGWFTAAAGGTQITTSYVFDRDAVIYAHWTFIGYNIALDTNDGVTSTSAITGTDGKLATLPAPTRNNYRFDGWFTAPTGGTQITTSYVFDRDTVIYAHWTYIGGGSTSGGSGSTPGAGSGNGTNPGATPGTSTGSSNTGVGSQQSASQPATGQTDGSSLPSIGSTTPTRAEDFTDSGLVAAWAVPFMDRLISSGIMNGYSDGTLAPKGNVTRAEFTKLIVSSLELSAGSNVQNFSDVSGTDWFKTYVDIAASLGLINGVGDGSFAPNNQITRQDLCAIVYRAMQNIVTTLPSAEGDRFADDSQIAAYAKDAVYALRQAGIVSGRDDGSFDPSAFATREETAKIICGLMDYVVAAGAGTPAASAEQAVAGSATESATDEAAEEVAISGAAIK